MEQQPTGAVASVVASTTPLSILIFDVEISYAQFLGFPDKRPQYIQHHQIEVPQYMHCWAAQWAGQSKMLADRQTSEESLARDDARIAESLAALVRNADIVIAHNSDGFDVPRLRNRLIIHDQEPLGPVATLDTLKVAKKLGFSHNSLAALAKEMKLGGKMDTPKDLWRQSFHGSDVALQLMLRYCKQDVALLAQVFDKLRPHATSLPRLVDGEGSFCPNCGSSHYQVRKYRRTRAGKSVQYQCQVCMRYFNDKTSDAGKSQMRPV